MITDKNPIAEIIEKHSDVLTFVTGVSDYLDEAREIYEGITEGVYDGGKNQTKLLADINGKLYNSLLKIKEVSDDLWRMEYEPFRNSQLKEVQRAYISISNAYRTFENIILRQTA